MLSTHAGSGIAFSSGAFNVGAGAGITVNAGDVALTTPGTLTVSTTNSATGNHTHAITSSCNPGVAASLLASGTAGDLSLSGILSILNETDSTTTNRGAILVSGGVGIIKSVTVGGQLGVASDPPATVGLTLSNGTTAAVMYVNDSGTDNMPNVMQIVDNTLGTPTTNFGLQVLYQLESTTNATVLVCSDQVYWAEATHASRKARRIFTICDTSTREAMHFEASGSAPMIGFLGASASARQTVTGSRGGNAALASLITALATLGLITDSTS